MFDWNDPDLDKRPELMYRPKLDARPISQLIACKQKFVQIPQGSNFDIGEYRAKVIRAIKVFVPYELMDERRSPLDTIRKFIHNDLNSVTFYEKQTKRYNQYRQFARAPFPLIFFENDTGGILVEQITEKHYRCVRTTNDGIIFPLLVEFEFSDTGNPEKDFLMHLVHHNVKIPPEIMDEIQIVCQATCVEVMEMFMFMNVSNIILHTVHPTTKELENVPKVLRPKFIYRCLDIFREKKLFSSLKEVLAFLQNTKTESEERRAHMVRGHFKAKKNGLFWWNSFLRCRKNIDEVGFVAKDYNLK